MTEREDIDKFFLISLDGVNETQRGQVQAQVEIFAISWWHQQQNIWIVQGGENTVFWRTRLQGFVTGAPGDLIILGLPEHGNRTWSCYATKSTSEWLNSTYASNDALRPEPKSITAG
ncbi:MAG: hypothetical protein Q8L08_08895 [Candidatus Nanopelagicaceae bacterium]|nr:hypothetical protein [Candidatus Nanopelagicaceae bacterium]